MDPNDPRHGSPAGHNDGCRCTPCCAAKLRYDKQRKYELHSTGQRRVVPSYRAVRRIHALQALGWSARVVAEHSGLITKTVYDISLERSTNTRRVHFDAIAAAYDRLAGTVPTGPYVSRNRRYALTQGWAPPLAWDDIDDPDEVPTGWAYQSDRSARLDDLIDQGADLWDVLRDLDLTRNTFQTWCTRHGYGDTYRTLAAAAIDRAGQRLNSHLSDYERAS